MNLPLDFNSAEPWTRIAKIALTIAAVYVIAVVGLFGKGNFLGGAVLLVFGLACSDVLGACRWARPDVSPPAPSPSIRCACGGSPSTCRAVSFRSIDFQPSAWPSTSSSYGQRRS